MALTAPFSPKRVPSTKPPNAAKRRRAKLRKEIWPDVTDAMIWSRENFKGFTSIPRTMPIIIAIINSLSKNSSGSVFFGIWCKAFEDFLVEIKDEYDFAFSAGYTGQRAIRSWRERVEVLEKNGFIKVLRSPQGGYRYILVLDPHQVIDKLFAHSAISKDYYSSLQITLINIGAKKD